MGAASAKKKEGLSYKKMGLSALMFSWNFVEIDRIARSYYFLGRRTSKDWNEF